ncbi:SH3 beta-barrel fold-containing protein [Pedobacter glucosidilyticus]|uniref:SH3 beta-barrel fold-containing protein n=1 Tax=Pedobacter glucosidilyticus TaxID=1122941 RepID=UPI00055C0071|nr:SH3 beta-barrel fold-containing protein [Pedobacter glucosidilyticus]
MRSLVFKTAWQLNSSFKNFSEALKHAWAIIKLKYKMLKGVVEFAYKKVDGSIRTAVGTLHAPHVNYEFKGQPSSNKTMAYFDLEQGSFRSFKIENLIY